MDTLKERVSHSLAQGVHFVFERFIHPRTTDEDAQRREFILNIFLVASIGLTVIFFVIALRSAVQLGDAYQGIPVLAMAGIVLSFVLLLWLSRRGWMKMAAFLFIGMYALPLGYALLRWGTDLPQGLLGLALLVVIAGVLLGTTASFIAVLIFSLFLLIVTRIHQIGVVVPLTYWRMRPAEMADMVAVGVTFFVIAVASWLSNREIEKSLRRARISEAALTVERDSLEHKVKERTKDLQRLQAEQLAHLHPFAEFGRLASGFFHDLSGPLTAVSLNLEQLSQKPSLALNDGREHVDRAYQATKRLEQFLKAVRSQVQQREIATFFSPLEEVTQILRVLEYRSRSAQVDVRLHAEGPQVRAYGNPFNFAKAVTNLIVNALDACEMLPVGKTRRIDVELSCTNGQLICRVRDTGPGIPAKHLPHIFKPFFTTKSPERGIGIGLSIVKEVAEQDFHGTIEAESREGEGTVLTLTLPLHASHPSTHAHERTEEHEDRG